MYFRQDSPDCQVDFKKSRPIRQELTHPAFASRRRSFRGFAVVLFRERRPPGGSTEPACLWLGVRRFAEITNGPVNDSSLRPPEGRIQRAFIDIVPPLNAKG
jgi:hypothetical protein